MFCYDPAISLTISLRLQINIGKIIMVKQERKALKVRKLSVMLIIIEF
jgi:hypothetical protein